ncbi:MAG: MBL fold metallo-hydrolase [Bacteroidetes bacterium]|nr:MAG: MBL fold metallo-hydrolase [Bacteroidota bacterium]
MKLVPIIPECFKLDGGACFGVVPKSIWSKHVPSDENNMVNISSRCLLVDTGERKILIDTGLGNKQSDKYYSYFYLFNRMGLEKALTEKGYSAEDITDVILTHLHFDHVGGAVKWAEDGKTPVAVFPNATYYCSKSQWDSANEPNPREKASFHKENYQSLYTEGRLEFIFENTAFCEGIDLELKDGHTTGQLIPVITYKNKKVVFTADFIATVLNIPLAYVPSFDVAPLKSMQEKEEFLNRAVNEDYILVFEHDYYHECCTLEKTEKGIRAGKIFNLQDI